MVDWGSVADWVSGLGSISAAVIALYLAGSERRASRERERPEVSVTIDPPSKTGWRRVGLTITNPAHKQWELHRAEMLRPKASLLIREEDTYAKGATPFQLVFSAEQRDERASRSIQLTETVRSFGTMNSASSGGGLGNVVYVKLQAFLGDVPGRTVMRLHFTSLEPRPDQFSVDVIRRFD